MTRLAASMAAPAAQIDASLPVQKTLFQTDCLCSKLPYSINWVLRSPLGAAWIQNVTW